MTTQQLNERIDLTPKPYGHYRIRIMYRGTYYFCTSNNTMAVDRIHTDERYINGAYYTTERRALLSLWNECKRANNLR